MRVKVRLFLIFTLVLVAVFSCSLISCSESTKTEQEQTASLFVMISSLNTDIEERSFSTEIQASLFDLSPDYSVIQCRIENYFLHTEFDHTNLIDGGQANLTLLFNPKVGHYEGNVSAVFRLFGLKEFYPFDSYLLNLTFTLPNFGLMTENNTQLHMYWGETYGYGEVDYSVTWDGEMAIVSSHVFLNRGMGGSANATFWSALVCSFLFLGSATLIKPERLEYRLTICLTLFIFSISYSSTMKVDGLSLGEVLMNALLSGTALFAVVSIIEKALTEVRPRLSVSHYILDGVLIIIAFWLTPTASLHWFVERIEVYPWQAGSTAVFSGVLAVPLLCFYVPKTFIFVVHSLWKNRARKKRGVSGSARGKVIAELNQEN